jgi:DNA-binding SARP family transcriptional activator/MFS family permease
MRWIGRAATAVIGVAIVLGPVAAAVLWARGRQWRSPSADQLHRWLDAPPPAAVVVVLIGGLAGAAWLLLSAYLLHRARRAVLEKFRRLRRMPLPTPAKMTAGSMVGLATLAMPSVAVPHPAPATVPVGTTDAGPTAEAAPTAPTGVDLPDHGWIPYSTALAVAAVGNLIWLNRRRHYQPRDPRPGRRPNDPDLQPLPATAEAIIASTPTPHGPQFPAAGTALAQLPTGRLALHGPGAMDAARALLITAVLSNALSATDDIAVTVPASDLTLLLDVPQGNLPRGLRIGEIHSPPPGEAGRDDADGHPGRPLTLLIEQPARPADQSPTAFHGDAEDAAEAKATVVVIGIALAGGQTWHVAADGTARTGDGPHGRLGTIGRQAAQDLLNLVQQHADSARPDPTSAAEPTTSSPDQPARAAGELRLLGGCRLLLNGAELHVRRSAGQQVLAYLGTHPDGATTAELIRAVWPGLNPAAITKRLHTTLTDLRQQLSPALSDAIDRRDNRYLINPQVVDTDLRRLRRALNDATSAISAPQRHAAAQALADAYPGELAAGFSWPWLHAIRETLRRDLIDAYVLLAAAAGPAEAVELLQAASAVDPYNDAVHEQACRILTDAGQADAATALRRARAQRLRAAGPTTDALDSRPRDRAGQQL